MKTMLLVGGPADGRRVEVENDTPRYYIAEATRQEVWSASYPMTPIRPQEITQHTYHWMFDNVMAHESLGNPTVTVAHLAKGYRQEGYNN